MAKKPAKKSTPRIKDLKTKKISADSAKRVKGGFGNVKGESIDPTHK